MTWWSLHWLVSSLRDLDVQRELHHFTVFCIVLSSFTTYPPMTKQQRLKQMLAQEAEDCVNLVKNTPRKQIIKDIGLLWNQSQSVIANACSFQVPPIARYSYSTPFPYALEWAQTRDQLKTLPELWKPLSVRLNQYGLGILELIRAEQRQVLASKTSCTEAERKWLLQVTQQNGVRRLFPYGYVDGRDIEYKRLVPTNDTPQKTSILNLRQELRNPVLECFNTKYLPGPLCIVPWDLASCHAAIFAGLGGKMMAPLTLEALKSGNMWDHALKQAKAGHGQKVQKKHLKTIFYKALNGGSLQTPQSIIETIQEKHSLEDEEVQVIAKELFELPIIQELKAFQTALNEKSYIYLPVQVHKFAGAHRSGYRSSNKADHPARSSYHAGLMTSRVFAAVEIILIIKVVHILLINGAIPLCLEHDGILVMGAKTLDINTFNTLLTEFSQVLVGLPIQLEALLGLTSKLSFSSV